MTHKILTRDDLRDRTDQELGALKHQICVDWQFADEDTRHNLRASYRAIQREQRHRQNPNTIAYGF